YGRSHRAVKLYTAEKAGVAGLIIYSDPADDGFVRGDTWPKGSWRTADQNQRGNGKYSWFWHGDALTPGAPALAGATRLDASPACPAPRSRIAGCCSAPSTTRGRSAVWIPERVPPRCSKSPADSARSAALGGALSAPSRSPSGMPKSSG